MEGKDEQFEGRSLQMFSHPHQIRERAVVVMGSLVLVFAERKVTKRR